MVVIQCPIAGCDFATEDVSEAVACVLLTTHSTIHTSAAMPVQAPKAPPLERPRVEMGITPEDWNIFCRRWDAFVIGSGLNANDCTVQLFQCAGPSLGDCLLKSYPTIVSEPTADLLKAMKNLAVIAVATGVARAELLSMRQLRDEPFRAFASRVRGKAETCHYTTKCPCTREVNFTDCITKDVLLAGVADLDIRREVLGVASIQDKDINWIISLIEGKEMARNSLPLAQAAISSFKRSQKPNFNSKNEDLKPPSSATTACANCKKQFFPFVRSSRGWNTKPYRFCQACHRSQRSKFNKAEVNDCEAITSEVGGNFAQISSINAASSSSFKTPKSHNTPAITHHTFSKGEWRRCRNLNHPKLPITISVAKEDYAFFQRPCPRVKATNLSAIADSGAQTCLWSSSEFYAAGFSDSDLLPVQMDLMAANKSPIPIKGSILLRIHCSSADGEKVSTAAMVYVSRMAKGLYLSMEMLLDLGILSQNFPAITLMAVSSEICNNEREPVSQEKIKKCHLGTSCSCPTRCSPPVRPQALPFECIPENNIKMKQWLLETFASSTFNTCPHQALPCMSGPPVEIHLKTGAPPVAVHKAASIPIHWQDQVHSDLLRDEALGVIEKVPYGEPVQWCHRMVVTRKHDGTPRRTVDLSPLNKHCKRETFASDSPFHLARRIPKGTWKTVCDA